MLEEIDEGLWVVEGEIVSFYGFPYPTRSVIARLDSRDLWVWSPIKLKADLRARLTYRPLARRQAALLARI